MAVDPISYALQNRLVGACKVGDLKEVTELLDRQRANADAYNMNGEHPLWAAVWGMNLDVVKKLISKIIE